VLAKLLLVKISDVYF